MVGLAGCGPKTPFSEANALMKAHVANDITLTIDEKSETRHPHVDGTYTVCGRTRIQQPRRAILGEPDLDEVERFLINVHDGHGGGYFDGDREPEGAAEFQSAWDRMCGPNSAHETFMDTD
jgi:hypothetical protein